MSKLFKLVKTYPGSPEIGEEVNFPFQENMEKPASYHNHQWFDPNDFPDYWEEVINKDYLITSFKSNKSIKGIPVGTVITLLAESENQFGAMCADNVPVRSDLASLLNNSKWSINSVKRLSDGEIFSIDDLIENIDNSGTDTPSYSIGKIAIVKNPSNEVVSIVHDNYRGKDLKGKLMFSVGNSYNNLNFFIENLTKQQPVFVSEDGVNIYKGNSFVSVNVDTANDTNYTIRATNIIADGRHSNDQETARNNGVLWFSTEQSAIDFIRKNKVIFVTEDGVKIKYGNEIFYIFTDLKKGWNGVVTDDFEPLLEGYYFSSQEALDNFVLLNNPCLSIQDVIKSSIFFDNKYGIMSGTVESLVEIVKKK